MKDAVLSLENSGKVIAAILAVMPDEMVGEAIAAGQRHSQDCWEWGDRCLRWVQVAERSGVMCTRGEVYSALSALCGIPVKTLRYYADIARFYSEDKLWARTEYEQLPFSHFALARSFGPAWREVLEYDQHYMDEHGRPAPAWFLEEQFSRANTTQRELEQALQDALQAMPAITPGGIESPFWDEVSEAEQPTGDFATRLALTRLDHALRALERVLERLPLSLETKKRLQSGIEALQIACSEALSELASVSTLRQ